MKAGPDLALVGSSPEIMVRVEGDKVTIRPLAGTRRRGATEEEDERLAAELLADPKERAEHIMLVDLGRNDVGRVARYGTVQISDVMTVERYSHVMHICSNVTGRLQPGKTAFDALRSCLPAGTLSGAPKVRAMEIIDELEPHRRGPYGGAVGYVDFSGNMDTCIALRTMVLKGKTAYLQAGAGIVADSVPAKRTRGDAEQGDGPVAGAGDRGEPAGGCIKEQRYIEVSGLALQCLEIRLLHAGRGSPFRKVDRCPSPPISPWAATWATVPLICSRRWRCCGVQKDIHVARFSPFRKPIRWAARPDSRRYLNAAAELETTLSAYGTFARALGR